MHQQHPLLANNRCTTPTVLQALRTRLPPARPRFRHVCVCSKLTLKCILLLRETRGCINQEVMTQLIRAILEFKAQELVKLIDFLRSELQNQTGEKFSLFHTRSLRNLTSTCGY